MGWPHGVFNSRRELIDYLERQSAPDFNRSRGEFDVSIYRIPEEGLNIRKKYGHYQRAPQKHRLLFADYMTADRLSAIVREGHSFRWLARGIGDKREVLKLAVIVSPASA